MPCHPALDDANFQLILWPQSAPVQSPVTSHQSHFRRLRGRIRSFSKLPCDLASNMICCNLYEGIIYEEQMACHFIYGGNHLQQVLERAAGKFHCKAAVKTFASTAMACIQVPKKGTFTCTSSTAEEAVEYLRQVSPGHLRVKQSTHWSTLFRAGQLSMVYWDPCRIFGKKVCVFLVETKWIIETMANFPSFQHLRLSWHTGPRLDEPWHGNVLLSCGPHKLEPKQRLQEFNADFVPRCTWKVIQCRNSGWQHKRRKRKQKQIAMCRDVR